MVKPPSPPHSGPPWPAATFATAAHRLDQMPPDEGAEVAVVGRSNAGKSSALNAITGKPALARVSKTPGRTQQLVVFDLEPGRRLVDLPGYGYAAVPVTLREHWGTELRRYFETRGALRGLVIAMDIRHPLRDGDRVMIALAAARALPVHVLLTKADKLGRGAAADQLAAVRKGLVEMAGGLATVQLFSSPKRTGVDEARRRIVDWLADDVPSGAEGGLRD
jgi:GTP-binding protein